MELDINNSFEEAVYKLELLKFGQHFLLDLLCKPYLLEF
jgi:hypothetical protein